MDRVTPSKVKYIADVGEKNYEDNSWISAPRKWVRVGSGLIAGVKNRQGIIALADQAVASVSNLLTGVIIGRACTKEEFGLYMLGFSIVIFVLQMQDSLISTAYMVYSPRLEASARARYTGSTLIHQMTLSALAILALALGRAALSFGIGPRGLESVALALVIVITFIMLKEYLRRVCFADLRMKTALFLDSCVAVVQVGGLSLLAYNGILSASRAYWVVGIACGSAALAWLISNRKTFVFRINQAISDFWRNWSSGKWVFASALLWAVSMNAYPWILATCHGTASTGVWAACVGITSLGNPLLIGVQNFLGPKIAHSYIEGNAIALRRYVFKTGCRFCILMMVFCTVLWICGDTLVVMLYGDKYGGNGATVSILALNIVVMAMGFSISRGLFVIERAQMDFKVNFLALFVLLTFGLWLVRSFGPLGAAYGLLISNSAASGLRWAAFNSTVRSLARKQAT